MRHCFRRTPVRRFTRPAPDREQLYDAYSVFLAADPPLVLITNVPATAPVGILDRHLAVRGHVEGGRRHPYRFAANSVSSLAMRAAKS